MRQPQEAVRLSQIARQIDALEPARRAARTATLADLARYGALLMAYLVALAVAVIGTIRLTGGYVSQAPVVFGTAALIAAVLVTAVASPAGSPRRMRSASSTMSSSWDVCREWWRR